MLALSFAMVGEYYKPGSDEEHFYFPRSIKVIGNTVYIADMSNNRIKVYDTDLNYLSQFGGIGVVSGPSSVDVLSTGELAVVSSNEAIVKIFDATNPAAALRVVGNYRIGADLMSSPNAADFDAETGEVYIADTNNSRVLVFDEKTAELKRSIGQFGYGFNPGDLLIIGGIKLHGDYLYVTSMYTYDVVVFTKQGEPVARFGGYGSEPGKTDGPYGIEFDQSGNIYISELFGGKIQKFSPDYQSLGYISTYGYGPGLMLNPFRMDVLSDNHMLVTDYTSHKVVEIDLDTNAVVNEYGSFGLGEGQLFYPFGISVDDKEEFILIGEAGNNRITILTRDFEFVQTTGQIGSLDDDFFFPSDIVSVKKDDQYLIPNRIRNQVVKVKYTPKETKETK